MATPHMRSEDVVTHRRLLKDRREGTFPADNRELHDASPLTEESMAVAAEGWGGHISLSGGRPPVVFSFSCGWTLSHTSS